MSSKQASKQAKEEKETSACVFNYFLLAFKCVAMKNKVCLLIDNDLQEKSRSTSSSCCAYSILSNCHFLLQIDRFHLVNNNIPIFKIYSLTSLLSCSECSDAFVPKRVLTANLRGPVAYPLTMGKVLNILL